ncbi:putative inner-membrane translocator, partial [Vibrio parahaemolyticus V-223/04]
IFDCCGVFFKPELFYGRQHS